jgi:hypothetical protein
MSESTKGRGFALNLIRWQGADLSSFTLERVRDFAMMRLPCRGGFPGQSSMDQR